jgi:signal peptidase II
LSRKWTTFATVFSVILTLDVITKRWALSALGDGRMMDLFDGLVPLRLAFNRGAAFGISIGDDPRWFFIPVTIIALVLLIYLLKEAGPRDFLRIFSVSLVISGAVGNLINRLTESRGVIDFLGPIDLGFMLWPIFNVADMVISTGAVLLAISFWMEDREERRTPDTRAKMDGEVDVRPEPEPS